MANLDRAHRLEKFVPDLGNNRELEKPFYLLIASGLSKEEYQAFLKRVMGLSEAMEGADTPEKAGEVLAGVFGSAVQMGAEPLTIQGKEVTSLAQYLQVTVLELMGSYNMHEVIEAVKRFNSVEGTRALFSERLSGGSIFTVPPRAVTH